MNPVIELKNIFVRYRKSEPWILEDTEFEGSEGEFIVVTGPSGGGKTTFINTINGVIQTEFSENFKGEIIYRGKSINKMPAAERALFLGSILQNADEQIIFEKVEDELAFALENIRTDPAEMPSIIKASARMMELELWWNTKNLSSGQKQRLISATTFSMGQKILLLDEPLANLDKNASEILLKNLKYLAEEKGYCIIIIEHRLDWLFNLADKFCWIENAKILSFSTSERFRQFLHKKTEFAFCNNPLKLQRPEYSEIKSDNRKIIELKKVKVIKSGRDILKNINFTLNFGDKWVFWGDNGAGKTSLIKLLSNIYKPSQGKRETSIKSKDTFKRIGYVLQNPNYQLFMPTVMLEISYKAKNESLVKDIIKTLNLEPLLERHPHSLSEGQKRRVGLAAILATEPDILFLDEPTVGQDYKNLENMINAISQIYKNKQATIITITHDVRCARLMGDKILIMEKGEIKAAGGHELINMELNLSSLK